ncbi:TPA: hypothetical protein JD340_22080 [Citrobacter freundii]|nr:hypothetical protein [Citrobacter freundii]
MQNTIRAIFNQLKMANTTAISCLLLFLLPITLILPKHQLAEALVRANLQELCQHKQIAA